MNKNNLNITLFISLIIISFLVMGNLQLLSTHRVGEVIDKFNEVEVFYNGKVSHVKGRNVSKEGYNIGLKWQCVEFVKRYYLEVYDHEMPDSYGHAKDFYNPSVKDGKKNKARGLRQFSNPSAFPPKAGDIIVFDKHIWDKFGHIAIISKVRKNAIEIVQQNKGIYGKSRENLDLKEQNGKWKIDHSLVLGRLSK